MDADQLVDQGAQCPTRIGEVGAAMPLQHPAQRAGHQGLDVGRRHTDRTILGQPQRALIADIAEAIPGFRVGAGHSGSREPGQLPGGGAATSISHGFDRCRDDCTQFTDQVRGGQHS
ncbi:Uncharacterised protein [Mycobacteroides abscessus subsp. massiliense]|nr:Uncharacterised protein [Mycobacteroides abscessus subsp. massiliense]